MSVINKMLRDLDQRHSQGDSPNLKPLANDAVMRDTLLVDGGAKAAGQPKSAARLILIAALLLLTLGAALWWYLSDYSAVARKFEQARRQAAAPVTATRVVPPSPMPIGSAPVAAVTGAVVASASAVAIPAPSAAASGAVAVAASAAQVTAAQSSAAATAPKSVPPAQAIGSLRMDDSLVNVPAWLSPVSERSHKLAKPGVAARLPAAKSPPRVKTSTPSLKPLTAAAMPTASPPPPTASVATRSPLQETLAQAQSMWNSGSRRLAIDLLQQALARAESANPASAGNSPTMASLVREIARMELAEGQVREVLDLTLRLEPYLSGVADIWAIRGNAAQRLGYHREAAAAYQQALRLRPDEGRWMVAQAISLAVQGQLTAASELAGKARSAGFLTPELARYLGQLGVQIGDR